MKNIFYILAILTIESCDSRLFGQGDHKIKFNKSEWFCEVKDSTIFPDTISLIKRLNFTSKFDGKSLNQNFMQFEPENEKMYLGHSNFGNFHFNYGNRLLFYSIKNGTLDQLAINWKFRNKRNKLTIYTKGSIYVYNIIKQEPIEISLNSSSGVSGAKTKMLTLIKIKDSN